MSKITTSKITTSKITITLGSHLAKVQTPRAAVVPYVIMEGEIFFLLGQDHQSGDITDLGGGVKKYESTLAAALREFEEESDEILGRLNPNDFVCSVALLNDQMGVLFIPLTEKWYTDAPKLFEDRKKFQRKKTHSEIDRLIWFNKEDFQRITKPEASAKTKMWKRIRKFYHQGCGDKFHQALYLTYHPRIALA